MSIFLQGVLIEAGASAQLQRLDPARRQRVRHTLEEMVAVVRLTSSENGSMSRERLYFNAAGVRVEYSIDDATALLTVHGIHDIPYARAS